MPKRKHREPALPCNAVVARAAEPGAGHPDIDATEMPALTALPAVDAGLLAEIQLLGHYPRSLNAGSRDTASAHRKAEHALHKRLERRKTSMDSRCLAFLKAVKDIGIVKQALDAASGSSVSNVAVGQSGTSAGKGGLKAAVGVSNGRASEPVQPLVQSFSSARRDPSFPIATPTPTHMPAKRKTSPVLAVRLQR